MARRRSLSLLWPSSLGRVAKAVTGASLRLQRKAVGQWVKTAVKAGKAASAAKTTQKPNPKPPQKTKTTKPAKPKQAAKPLAARKRLKPGTPPQRTPPAGAATTGQDGRWSEGVVLGPAGLRRYRLFHPPGQRPGVPGPLLLMLHGCQQDAEGFARGTRIARQAARHGCWVLCPEQDRSAHPQACWNWYATRSGRAQAEAATLLAAVDQVLRLHPVDPLRCAVAGLSAGAGMAALLATGWPARFRAVVMHSGVPPGQASSTATAVRAMAGRPASSAGRLPPAGTAAWPPLLVLHGSSDRVVALSNAWLAVRQWAGAVGAVEQPVRPLQRGRRHPMQVSDFSRGRQLVARLCVVQGLGHAWSGGDGRLPFNDPQGPDASALLMAFVQRCWQGEWAGGHNPPKSLPKRPESG